MRQRVLSLVALGFSVLLTAAYCNKPPVALFPVDHVDGPSPLTVQFDASTSLDPDGRIATYAWDFGDGNSAIGEYASHTFVSSVDRSFSVELTVTDNLGAADSTAGSIFVRGAGSGAVLFFDDFEDGLDPAWAFTSGNWAVEDGKLWESDYLDPPLFGYVIGGEAWTDYKVDVDVHRGSGSCWSKQGIVLRATDDLNKVVLWGGGGGRGHCEFGNWFTVIQGGQAINSGGWVVPEWPAGCHLTIEARGDNYMLYVNGVLRTEFTDSTHLAGRAGVAVQKTASFAFDNFRVTSLE